VTLGSDVCSYVELRFFDADGTRRQVVLPEARGVSAMEELAGDGAASYRASLLAQAITVDPELLEDGLVQACTVLQTGQPPVPVAAWVQKPTSGTVIAEAGQEETSSINEGLRSLLLRAVVFPEVVRWDTNTEDARLFGWMSAQDPLWYDAGDWSAVASYGILASGQWPSSAHPRKITVDLTPAIGDEFLVRSTFYADTAGHYKFYWLGDDATVVYLNSKHLADNGPSGDAAITHIQNQVLPVGTHTIAASFKNLFFDEAKFCCAITKVNPDGSETLIRQTDTTHWVGKKIIGGNYPGWTAAAIFLKLLQEAQDRNVEGLDYLVPDFTATLDSNGDPWPTIEDAKAFEIGTTTLADALRQLEELAFDLRILPDGTVQAFIEQGEDVSDDVWLQEGSNLLGLTYQGADVLGTRALLRAVAGWTAVTDATGAAAYGMREIGITSGNSGSIAQGARLAARALRDMARRRYVYTATFRAVEGRVPFLHFKVGDTITCLNRKLEYVLMRVLSLSLSTPDDVPGPVTFTAELEEL
jgi:hypothetical protein